MRFLTNMLAKASLTVDGVTQLNTIANATTDTDKFLVSDGGIVKYRTGAEVLSDIGAAMASGYIPYIGASANVDLGTFDLTADVITGATGSFASNGGSDTFAINHSSGSGIALNITKGGNNEGLYINKTSGSGNAATIIGTLNATTLVKSGGTSSQYLMADGSVSTLTNPVTGTGTTNTLPKFTGASTIGNSNITDSGSLITLGSNSRINGNVGINIAPQTNFNFTLASNITGGTGSQGFRSAGIIQSDVTNQAIYYSTVAQTAASSFSLSQLFHYQAFQSPLGAGSAVTSQFGFVADATLIGATNNYGFFGNIAAGSNRWNIYMQGTANNHMAGSLGIGSTSLTGRSLVVSKNMTGATGTNGVRSDGQIQSDATSTNAMYNSVASTAAASFTTAAIVHYYAQQGTFGAGSTVSAQYGFIAEGSLIGAGSNFGFYSNIPAAAGRWNFYAAGTANNYMAGSLGIGTTSLTGRNLFIDKSLTGSTVSVSVFNTSTIQSDVTNTATYFRSDSSTQAASFTINTLRHYFATQATFGAGSTVLSQIAFDVSSALIGGTTNYGFKGAIPAGTGRFNLFMDGTAPNFLAGDTGIGVSQNYVSSGPILTTTLTNGGSGYVDGTYTDVASTNITSAGNSALYTVVVSGGIVTSATLTWGGMSYRVGDTVTVSNTLLGGAGSGLIITVNTVDSSQLTISNANGGDISLLRLDTSLAAGDNLGTIKFLSNDTSSKASGLQAEIGAFGQGAFGGAYLSFLTRSGTSNTSLVEAMRIGSEGGVGISATALTGYSLRLSKNITGATTAFGIASDGEIQSGVTSTFINYRSIPSTAAASFTLTNLYHYTATNGTLGAGSAITNQYGYWVSTSFTNATNNYAFYSDLSSAAANRWNLYMAGTAANYLAGKLSIGTTSLTEFVNIANSTNGVTRVLTTNTNAGTATQVQYQLGNGTHTASLGLTGSSFTTSGVFLQGGTYLTSGNSAGGLLLNTGAVQPIYFGINNAEVARFGTNGALGLGTGASINASAQLQVDSTTQGFLPPRQNQTQRNAIASPAEGLIVYQTDGVAGLYVYSGGSWKSLTMTTI